MAPASPRITSAAWGRLEVAGLGAFKDAKLWPGGGREWNWRETGTRHSPGIQPADLEELVGHGCAVVVLSRGMARSLEVSPEAILYLEERDVEVIVDETERAVARYNAAAQEGRPVGALIHSTC